MKLISSVKYALPEIQTTARKAFTKAKSISIKCDIFKREGGHNNRGMTPPFHYDRYQQWLAGIQQNFSQPVPLSIDSISYQIMGASNTHLTLREVGIKNIYTRTSSLPKLIEDKHGLVLYDGKKYSLASDEDGDNLVLIDFSNKNKTSLNLPDLLKDNTKFEIVLDGDVFTLAKILNNNKIILTRSKELSTKNISYSQLPNSFEARIKGEELNGPYKLSKIGNNKFVASNRGEKKIIDMQDITPTTVSIKNRDYGNVEVDSFVDTLDSVTKYLHPTQMGVIDKLIGTLTHGKVFFGESNLQIEKMAAALDLMRGNIFIRNINYLRSVGDGVLNDASEHFYSALSSRAREGNVSIELGRTEGRSFSKSTQLLKNAGAKVKKHDTLAGTVPIFTHQKTIVSENGQAVFTTAPLSPTPHTSGKHDITTYLPKKEAKLFYEYERMVQNEPKNTLKRRELLHLLAKKGVLINDPDIDSFMVTRGINKLIQEANKDINIFFGDLSDDRISERLIRKSREGVDISLGLLNCSYDGLKPIYQEFKNEIKMDFPSFVNEFKSGKNISFSFKSGSFNIWRNNRGLNQPYLHGNVLAIDQASKMYVGTAYAWDGMTRNASLPDGASFESGVIFSGKMAGKLSRDLNEILTPEKKLDNPFAVRGRMPVPINVMGANYDIVGVNPSSLTLRATGQNSFYSRLSLLHKHDVNVIIDGKKWKFFTPDNDQSLVLKNDKGESKTISLSNNVVATRDSSGRPTLNSGNPYDNLKDMKFLINRQVFRLVSVSSDTKIAKFERLEPLNEITLPLNDLPQTFHARLKDRVLHGPYIITKDNNGDLTATTFSEKRSIPITLSDIEPTKTSFSHSEVGAMETDSYQLALDEGTKRFLLKQNSNDKLIGTLTKANIFSGASNKHIAIRSDFLSKLEGDIHMRDINYMRYPSSQLPDLESERLISLVGEKIKSGSKVSLEIGRLFNTSTRASCKVFEDLGAIVKSRGFNAQNAPYITHMKTIVGSKLNSSADKLALISTSVLAPLNENSRKIDPKYFLATC